MHEDVRLAIRSLRQSWTFTAVALAVLALGIGAGTTIFSVVDAVVLRGLPFDEHDRLVAVLESNTHSAVMFDGATTAQTYFDWRGGQRVFDGLAAVSGEAFGLRDGDGHPQTVQATVVTAEFFAVLRVAPMLGRAFTVAEEDRGRHRVVILSHGFWQRVFAGAPDVVGRTLALDDEPWMVVGVMPRGFTYPVDGETSPDIYVPPGFADEDRVKGDNHNYHYTAIGRLKPGVSAAAAAEQMNRLAAAVDAEDPAWSPGLRVRVVTLHEHLVGAVRSWMMMLLGGVVLLLVVACANVANLMLARATVRGPELAVRSALGATRWRIARALLVEALLLSGAGAAVGVVIAWAGVQAIVPWLPAALPRVSGIAVNLRVLAAAACAATVTGVGFGLVPAIQSSRPRLTTSLMGTTRSTTAGAGSRRLRDALVVAEVTVAAVLVVGAGLFIGSFGRLIQIEPGFDYRRVLTVRVGIARQPGEGEQALQRGQAYLRSVVDAVERVPGVEAAAVVAGPVPLSGSWQNTSVTLPGRGELTGEGMAVERRVVTPGFLPMLRVPLLRGRHISDDDRAGTRLVVVINRTAARRYWPGQDALGQPAIVGGRQYVVVGIVGDIRDYGPESPSRPTFYQALAQSRVLWGSVLMRTVGDPMRVLPAVKQAIWSVNPDQRIAGDIFTLEGYMDRLVAQRRFYMLLLSLFGGLGLTIAAAGIYGVMAYLVAQRTTEIGVRMALGATPDVVVFFVLRRATLLVTGGLALGAAGSWYFGRAVQRFLFQVEPTDPVIFAVGIAVLALAALVASAVPAWRAASVDPVVALRQQP